MKKIIGALSITTVAFLAGCNDSNAKIPDDVEMANGDIKVAINNTLDAIKSNITINYNMRLQDVHYKTSCKRTDSQLRVESTVTAGSEKESSLIYYDKLNTNQIKQVIKDMDGDWQGITVSTSSFNTMYRDVYAYLNDINLNTCNESAKNKFTCIDTDDSLYTLKINDYFLTSFSAMSSSYEIKIDYSNFYNTKVSMPKYAS